MALKCPNCNEIYSDGDLFCVHCGFKLVNNQVPCPKCNHLVDNNSNFCFYCGRDLTQLTDIEKDYRRKFEKLLRPKKFICPVCSNETLNEICEVCGVNFSKFCPNCGRELLDGEKFCINCGKKFNDDIKYAYCNNCVSKQELLFIEGEFKNPHCINCGRLMEKILTDNEYEDIVNNQFSHITNLDLSNELKEHVLAILVRDYLYGKDNDADKLVQELLSTDLNDYIFDLAKKELIRQFNEEGFVTIYKYGGEEKRVMVSEEHYEEVTIPVTESSHSGLTRILATEMFGTLGYIASSGVSTRYKTETVLKPAVYTTETTPITEIVITLSNDNVIYDVSNEEKKDRKTIKWQFVDSFDEEALILKDGTTIRDLEYPDFLHILQVIVLKERGCFLENINNAFFEKYISSELIENLKTFYFELINSKLVDEEDIPHSDADELLKWYNLLEKGIITQEEFDLKKKQLLN